VNAFVLNTSNEYLPPHPQRLYRFRSAQTTRSWPMSDGRHLGACGMWNFLWRLGVHPRDCTLAALPRPQGSILWATLEEEPAAHRVVMLREWIAAGGYIVAAGDVRAWVAVFGWNATHWISTRPGNPYAALASIIAGYPPALLAPPSWQFAASSHPEANARFIGELRAVQGERQTASRATLTALPGAPAFVAGPSYCYVNGNPFAALQAWLQGQEDLQPWLAWRHRLFWLDEWIAWMAAVLSELPALPADLPRPGIPGLAATTVVLRHDVDHSRDLSYLHEEVRRGLATTHAVLYDENTRFWCDTLATHPSHECAFHYTTGRRDWVARMRGRLKGRVDGSYVAAPSAVARNGLLRQVRRAKTHRVGVATLHRHLAFLLYPEWIDGMHTVLERQPEVLGGSSLFRAQVLRWGADRVDGAGATVGEWPDAQFPLWLPIKLAHAGLAGKRLRGWESASMMEAEPELVDQMLSHRLPGIAQRVVTLGYHPAHAQTATFARDGSMPAFRQVLDVIAARGADVKPLRDIYRKADEAIAS
jgi:hypothetical protein